MLPIGLITSLYGVIGAIGADRLRRFVGFMVLSSIGTILIAFSLMNAAAWSAGLYYLVHSTLIAASFYLLCGWITSQRGAFKDHFKIAPKMKQDTAVATTFFIIALMMAGLPPFSGFLGKVLILQSTAGAMWQGWIIGTILVVSLLSILAFTRVGFILFWRATAPESNPAEAAYTDYQALPHQAPARNDWSIYLLLSGLVVYVACASPILNYVEQTVQQLRQPQLYQQQILKRDQHGQIISVLPFDSTYVPETKYGGEKTDPNARYIPQIISENSLNGGHISSDKQQQIKLQNQVQPQQNIPELKQVEQ